VQLRRELREKKCWSRWTVSARSSTRQVPMPLVPSQGSLQTAPIHSPQESKVRSSPGAPRRSTTTPLRSAAARCSRRRRPPETADRGWPARRTTRDRASAGPANLAGCQPARRRITGGIKRMQATGPPPRRRECGIRRLGAGDYPFDPRTCAASEGRSIPCPLLASRIGNSAAATDDRGRRSSGLIRSGPRFLPCAVGPVGHGRAVFRTMSRSRHP